MIGSGSASHSGPGSGSGSGSGGRSALALALLGVVSVLGVACGEDGASAANPDARPRFDGGTGGGGDGGEGKEPDAAPVPIVSDGTFDVTPFDTGNLIDRCTMMAPAGADSWGVNAATFSDPVDPTLDTARFRSGGSDGYLYGLEDRGRWGLVRYVQGDVWGGGACGPIVWNTFAPVPTSGRDLGLTLDVYRDTTNLFTASDSWILFAVNLWFSSPDLPDAGGDLNGRKPLVMDLSLFHQCNLPACGLASFEDADAYHYQATVGEAAFHVLGSHAIDVSEHLRQAVAHFGLPAAAEQSLALYQIEFVIELVNAEGAATIDNVVLSVD